jgi:hypothetical protein
MGPKATSGFGVAALVLGILACLTCWIPFVGILSIPLSALGILFGVIGILVSAVGRRSGIEMPVAGSIVCIVALAIAVASTGGTSAAINQALHDADRKPTETNPETVLVFGIAAEKQTKTTMRVVLSAIYAYQEVAGAFPPDMDPNKPADPNKYATSGRTLKLFLTGTGQGMSGSSPGVPAAVERLRNLSTDALGSADGGFADGWGTGIRYRPAGGFGGKPLLVSAGPDKLFGESYQEATPPVLVIGDPNQRKDNIYYDGE